MTNLKLTLFTQEAQTENLSALNQVFQQIQDGASKIHDGINVIKDEFLDIYGKAGSYLANKVVLPVNNFLKDLGQIDTELQLELTKEYIISCRDNSDTYPFGNGHFPCNLEQNY